MQCPFCKHEVGKGAAECPYCHYQFDVNAEVLSENERDSFEGVTIEEDGSTSGGSTTYEEPASYPEQEKEQTGGFNGIRVHNFGGYGCLIWFLLILFIMIFIAVSFVKFLFAVPVLGVIVGALLLNSMFHWF